jgi:hypothetical protein
MKLFRSIPIEVHSAVEVLAAPLLIVAPFVLGFGALAGAISIALGVALVGLGVSLQGQAGERATLPLTAHAGFDQVIAAITIAVGLALLLSGQIAAGIFMAGFGSAHMALSASTRYSRPLGA